MPPDTAHSYYRITDCIPWAVLYVPCCWLILTSPLSALGYRLDWPVRTLSFSHDGKMLASASEDHFIDIAEVETGNRSLRASVGVFRLSPLWPSALLLPCAFSSACHFPISFSLNEFVSVQQAHCDCCSQALRSRELGKAGAGLKESDLGNYLYFIHFLFIIMKNLKYRKWEEEISVVVSPFNCHLFLAFQCISIFCLYVNIYICNLRNYWSGCCLL